MLKYDITFTRKAELNYSAAKVKGIWSKIVAKHKSMIFTDNF